MSEPGSPDEFAKAMNERRSDPAKVAKPLADDFAGRVLGLILLAAGTLMFLLYTYTAIVDAQAQLPTIDYRQKFTFVQLPLVMMGLVYTIFGEHASKVLGPTSRPSGLGWAFVVVMIAASFAYVLAIERHLNSLGYPV
jgi:Mn2+/Fe2+ NRAMP family transporter